MSRHFVYVTLCLALSIQLAAAKLMGGYVRWDPSPRREKILLDYTMFLGRGSEEYNLCTDQAIKENRQITTNFNLRLWESKPERRDRGVLHKTRMEVKCVRREYFYVVAEMKDFEISVPPNSFIGFSSDDTLYQQPIYTEVKYTTNANTQRLNRAPRFSNFPFFEARDGHFYIKVSDDDNDRLSCYDVSTQKFSAGECKVEAKDRATVYTISVQDFPSQGTRNPSYSQTVFQFYADYDTTVEQQDRVKDYTKSELNCDHEKMSYLFKPKPNVKIDKITLRYDFCKMKFNRFTGEYDINAAYTLCGTEMHEEKEFIVFKNVAQVFFINESTSTELITRAKTLNIGLECRLQKSSIQTLKGVKNDSDGIIVGPQHIEINDYAYGKGSFRIDFEVYKSLRYNDSYGSEEFPIHVSLANRIYFEISLDKPDLRIVPHNCFATKTRNYLDPTRYHIIQDRCPKDQTFEQHKYTNNKYQFSVQAFSFKTGEDSLYVHCHTYVCRNETDAKCRFGCTDDVISRSRRSTDTKVYENIDGYMTSTLEIKINDTPSTNQPKSQQTVATTNNNLLIYLQIPLALLVIGLIFIAWKCIKQNRTQKMVLVEDEQSLTERF